MKRFFTKKSIALIVAIFIVSSFLPFHVSYAALPCPAQPLSTNIESKPGADENVAKVQNLINEAENIRCKAEREGRILTNDESAQISSLQQQARELATSVQKNAANLTGNKRENLLNAASVALDAAGNILDFSKNFITAAIPVVLENMIIPVAAFLLAVAGSIMDFSIQYTIYGSGFADMNSAIQGVWVLIRDTLNVFFIFILLYAAIQQIVYGSAPKQILKSVIIAAVLINFSLFATRIIVDASNIVATAIYDQLTSQTSIRSNIGTNAVDLLTSKSGVDVKLDPGIDLSGRLMDSLGLVTVFDISNTDNTGGVAFDPKVLGGVSGIILSVVRIILFLTTTYVFLFIAAILVGRFVMLILIMAVSPLAFLAGIGIPRLEGYSKGWWDILIGQSLIAPYFTFLMLLTVRLAQTLTSTNKGNAMIIFFNFYLVIYLMLKSVSLLKEFSGSMAGFAESVASKGLGLALGTVTGAPAFIARQTVGRAANALAESSYGQRLEAYKGFGSTVTKAGSSVLKDTASSTFDIRGTDIFKDNLNKAGGLAGGATLVDEGYSKIISTGEYKGGKTGYSGLVETRKQEASEEVKKAEKIGKDYPQKIIDRDRDQNGISKMEESYKEEKRKEKNDLEKKKINLENTLSGEGDDKKKTEIREEITKIEKEIDKTEKSIKSPSANEIVSKRYNDFETAENKINEFEKKQKELEKNKDDLVKEIARGTGISQNLIDAEKAAQDRLNSLITSMAPQEERDKQLEILKAAQKAVADANPRNKIIKIQDDIERLDRDYKEAKKKIKEAPSEFKVMFNSRQARKEMVKKFRERWLRTNTLGQNENLDIAAKLEREAPKEKTEKEKEAENIAKELKALQDKDKQ